MANMCRRETNKKKRDEEINHDENLLSECASLRRQENISNEHPD
jgi:hypothetical protein